ncbi:MAG: hypothetical protein IJ165_07905 [Proteobacteria bacterium]|nr:hypothetical protein [Pseudomonadota bacterium]
MRIRNVILIAAALLAAGCSSKKDEPKPSGLKNMAPPSIQETVQDGLDIEPNNSALQASAVAMTGDTMQWSGTLTGDDVDVYRIQAKNGTIADITVTPESDFDILADLSVNGTDKDSRSYDTAGPAAPELLPNIMLSPQGIYLTVRGRLSPEQNASYKVSVARLSPEYGEYLEMEPNDEKTAGGTGSPDIVYLQKGNSPYPPSVVNGSLFPTGDIDLFRIHLTSPASFAFELPQTAVEVAIEYQGKAIWSQISRTAQNIRSDLLIPEKEDYYVRIKSLENIQEPQKYTFTVTPLDKMPDEIEPNNTIEKAQILQGDIQSLEFSLLDDADVDIFRVMVPEGKIGRARLVGPQQGQAKLVLIAEDGSIRKDSLAQDTTVCDAPPQNGSLLLKVLPGTASTAWPLAYKLSTDLEDALSIETEPNQSPAQATHLELDHELAGHIFPAGDIDVYKIALPSFPHVQGPVGTLNIDIDAGYIAELQLKLQDQDGFEISQTRSTQLSKPIHLAFDAPNGTYTLLISGAGDNCLKPYRLKASFTPNESAMNTVQTEAAQADSEQDAQMPAPAQPDLAPAAPSATEQQKTQNTPQNSDEIGLDDLIKAAQTPPQQPKKPAVPADDEDSF